MAANPSAGATVTTDKRFRRAHVKPARRRSPASKHAWMAARLLAMALVITYAGYRGVISIAAASSLQIGHMVVRGQERMSTGEVLSLVEGLRGQNILASARRLADRRDVAVGQVRRSAGAARHSDRFTGSPIGISRLGSDVSVDGKGVIVVKYGRPMRYRSADHRRVGRLSA